MKMMKVDLKKIFKEKDLTPAKLAREKDIPANIAYNLVNGKQYPYPGYRKKIAEFLDMPEEELFPEYQQEKEEGKDEESHLNEYLGLYDDGDELFVVKIKAATKQEAKCKFIGHLNAKITEYILPPFKQKLFEEDIYVVPLFAIKEVI